MPETKDPGNVHRMPMSKETAVPNVLPFQSAAETNTDADRHAYNAAFEELGLTWHWDAATYARLKGRGPERVRIYLESEHAHLLRAYEADFLVEAVETAKARCQDQLARELAMSAHYSGRADAYSRQAA